MLLFSIYSIFLATSGENVEPPTDTVPVQDAMGAGKDYVVVVMDYFNLTETEQANCRQVAEEQKDPASIGPGQCELVVEARLCFLDEKYKKCQAFVQHNVQPVPTTMKAGGRCVKFDGVRVWRGNARGRGASTAQVYGKLSCLSWALGEDFQVFAKEPDELTRFYPKHAAVERAGIGCIAWAKTESIDTETKSKIDRGYFQLSAKFSQIEGEKDTVAITDLLPTASQGFHLAPTRLHLAFYNGSPCLQNACTHLEFRFGVFTESGQSPRANAAILKPRVKVYDER